MESLRLRTAILIAGLILLAPLDCRGHQTALVIGVLAPCSASFGPTFGAFSSSFAFSLILKLLILCFFFFSLPSFSFSDLDFDLDLESEDKIDSADSDKDSVDVVVDADEDASGEDMLEAATDAVADGWEYREARCLVDPDRASDAFSIALAPPLLVPTPAGPEPEAKEEDAAICSLCGTARGKYALKILAGADAVTPRDLSAGELSSPLPHPLLREEASGHPVS